MALDGNLRTLPGAVAGEDMSNHLYRLVKLTTSGTPDPITVEPSDGTASEPTIGVAYTNPVSGAIEVAIGGVMKVVAGTGGLDLGDSVVAEASGAAIAGGTFGIVVKAAAVGGIAELLVA